ncbi:hypothetical protein A2875_03745 [Candidatus Gottesmanbacteria bacterium RIFCSPHIGHO2_01_FULL_46_14]|uniref:SpoVT-AbrB domain-containing protein n=3 Tax=Candidatus Gottesmaniibacteriota TaxID=1752720 RepID=A0A1F5ZND0_9BACT|nr:MAG: hypothetical protein UY08_C0006G0008 [Candidatus Gottesmanbacteria bacterium GW2011_GWA1_47_8]OGG13855.1 MAG: hypothetical protein A2875_03745 [Candidatus Gottesmanbacteria bacterium RIFCSPHIGHO2_01_FULL_46_14]OGG29595.1 MAG: hypothetical protein A2971_00960 [Candidatus Gottesmanbacteria bacterium RIFCSPLOWO2_01_FULL_46_21]
MVYPTTITQKWQMTIPRAVRKAIGLKHPGRVMLTVEPQRKAFRIDQPLSILELAGAFTPKDKRKIINAVKARDLLEISYERA